MPTLGAALNFAQLEGRNFRAHQLSAAPGGPVTGQLYYDTVANTLYWWDGTTWQAARSYTTPPATATALGTIQLAGDLGGGGPANAPVIANSAITSAKILDGTITDVDVNAANKDGAIGTYAMRTLGLGAQQAMPGNERLDQITAPANPVSLNGQRLINVADPTGTQDGATKNYVDTLTQGVSWKQPVRAATTVNITLSGTQTVDTVALNVGDRVMVKNQASQVNNGVYVVQSGAWTRAPDFATWAQFVQSVFFVMLAAGSVNGGTCWVFDQFPGGTIGSSNVYWDRYPALVTVGGSSIVGRALDATTTLDTIQSPAAALYLNNKNITSLADPVNPQDGATKNYVDNAVQGLSTKNPCLAATTGANITLSGTQTIDGVALAVGNRVLVKDQTTPATNGIYVVAAGAWTRAPDLALWAEVPDAYTWIEQGTANADTAWVCTSDPGGTLGTTAITWTMFSSANVVTAGAGLVKAGSVISANPDGVTIDTAGAGSSLEVKPGSIGPTQIATGGVVLSSSDVTGTLPLASGGTGQTTAKAVRETAIGAAGYYNNNATHGAGTTISIPQATHGLRSSRGIVVQVQDNTSGNVEIPDITVAANGDVTVTYAASLAANSKLVTLVG